VSACSLGEVVAVRSSLVDPTDDKYGHFPHIAPDTIERDTGRLLPYKTVKESGVQSGKYRFEPGDVLYSKIRPNLNKVALVNFEGLCSADMYALHVDQTQLTAPFLENLLRSPIFVDYATNLSGRANIPKVNRDQLLHFRFELPPVDQQRRIAAILDQADTLRVKRQRVITLIDDLAPSVFLEMFGNPSDRATGWSRAKLGELIAEGPQNGLYKASSAYGQGSPIVRIDSFQDGSPIDFGRLKRVRVSESESKLYALDSGDIILNRVNARTHLGKATIVSGLTELTLFESNMMRFRLDVRNVLPEYVVAFLGTPYAKNQIRTAAKDAVNQSSINQKDVKSFELPLPPIELQTEYVHRYHAAKQLQSRCVSSLGRFDHLFTALQSRAFSGQL
jgi:type I restriction enzyme S subunit